MPAADPGEDGTPSRSGAGGCGCSAYRQLTQKELAERTGVNQADISKLEKGTRQSDHCGPKRLADGLDMDFVHRICSKKSR